MDYDTWSQRGESTKSVMPKCMSVANPVMPCWGYRAGSVRIMIRMLRSILCFVFPLMMGCGVANTDENISPDASAKDPTIISDTDGDSIDDALDNCPAVSNPLQEDADNDAIGNLCDNDIDLQGFYPIAHPVNRAVRYPGRFADKYRVARVEPFAPSLRGGVLTVEGSPCWGSTTGGSNANCQYDEPRCGLELPTPAHSVVGVVADEHNNAYVAFQEELWQLSVNPIGFEFVDRHPLDATSFATVLLDAQAKKYPHAWLWIKNLALVNEEAGPGILLLANLYVAKEKTGDKFFVPVVLVLDRASFALRWAVRLDTTAPSLRPTEEPPNCCTQNVGQLAPAELHTSRSGAIVVGLAPDSSSRSSMEYVRVTRPSDGIVGVARPLTLHDGDVFYDVRLAALTDDGLWVTAGPDLHHPRPEVCGKRYQLETWMLRIYGPSQKLLWEENIHRDHWRRDGMIVDRERINNEDFLQVRVFGTLATDGCYVSAKHRHKDPAVFSSDENHPTSCPKAFENNCREGNECPCTNCAFTTYPCKVESPANNRTLVQYSFQLLGSGIDRRVPLKQKRAFSVTNPQFAGFHSKMVGLDGQGSLVLRYSFSDLRNEIPEEAEIWRLKDSFRKPSLHGLLFDTPSDSTSPPRFATLLGDDNTGNIDYNGLAIGQTGKLNNLVSLTPFPSTGLKHRGRSGDIYPVGPYGHMIAVLHQRLVVYEPAESYALDGDMTFPSAAQPVPVVPACHDPEACPTFNLGITDLTRPYGAHETHCIVNDWVGNRYLRRDCSRTKMMNQWLLDGATGLSQVAFGGSWGQIEASCNKAELQVRTTTEYDGDYPEAHRYLSCGSWHERYRPGKMDDNQLDPGLDLVRLLHPLPIAAECTSTDEPVPLRAILVDLPPLIVKATDTNKNVAGIVLPGDKLSVTVELANGSGDVDYQLVSGDAHFAVTPEASTITQPLGKSVSLLVDGPGIITVKAVHRGHRGEVGRTGRTQVLAEGPENCRRDSASDLFSSCQVLAPTPVMADESWFESNTAPAVAGAGVLLHDLSLRLTSDDLHLPSLAMPLVIRRTYRSRLRPREGGLMGGWTLGFDQRLITVSSHELTDLSGNPPDSCHTEPIETATDFHMAMFDGDGRQVLYEHPGIAPKRHRFGPDNPDDEAFLTYNQHTGTLDAPLFSAEVDTYGSPPGVFNTLKRYTLILDDPKGSVADVHPYYIKGQVRDNETRFYELTEPNGYRRIFNCRGQLLRLIDPQFQEIELEYSGPIHNLTGAPLLQTIVDTQGRRFQVSWRSVGPRDRASPRVVKIEDPYGRYVTYGYEPDDRFGALLTRATTVWTHETNPQRTVRRSTTYVYDSEARLVEVKDSDENSIMRITWDEDDVIKRQELGAPNATQGTDMQQGAVYTFVGIPHDTLEGRFASIEVTDPRGFQQTVQLEQTGGDGPLAAAKITVAADLFNGDTQTPEANRDTLTTVYNYNDAALLESITTPEGRGIRLTYDDFGRVTERKQIPNGTGSTITESFTYQGRCGILKQFTDVGGNVTNYEPYPLSSERPGEFCRHRRIERAPVPSDDEGSMATFSQVFTYEDAGPLRGKIKSVEDHRNDAIVRTVSFEYVRAAEADNQGQTSASGKTAYLQLGALRQQTTSGPLPTECDPHTAPDSLDVQYQVNTRGNITSFTQNGATVHHEYDGKGRRLKSYATAGAHESRTEITYDVNDRVIQTSEALRLQFADPNAEAPTAQEVIQEFYYDLLGRRIGRVRHAPGLTGLEVEVWAYDASGYPLRHLRPGAGATDADLMTVANQLRSFQEGHEILSSPPLSFRPMAGPVWALTEQAFTPNGKLAQRRLTDGVVLPAQDDPFLHTITERLFYDPGGNLVLYDPGRTDRRVRVSNHYDGNNRLIRTAVHDPACSGETALQTTTYANHTGFGHPRDVTVRGTISVADGANMPEICDAGDVLSRSEIQYDSWGRVFQHIEHGHPLAPKELLTDTHTTPSRIRKTVYNILGQPTLISGSRGVERRAYTAFGDLCIRQWSEDLRSAIDKSIRYTFGANGLLDGTDEYHGREKGTIILRERYIRDPFGRIVERENAAGLVWKYAYDSLGQLRRMEEPDGLLHYTSYNALSQVVKVQRRSYVSDEIRQSEFTLQAGFILGESQSGNRTSSNPRRNVLFDVAGNPAVVYPYGTGQGAPLVTNRHNETGAPIRRVLLSGATEDLTYDGLGNLLSKHARSDNDSSAESTRTLVQRHNGLSQPTYAQISNGHGPTHRMHLYSNSFNNVLEQVDVLLQGPTGLPPPALGERRVRARYDENGVYKALFFPGAKQDKPSLTMTADNFGRITQIRSHGSHLFQHLVSIDYEYRGDFVAERLLQTTGDTQPLHTQFETSVLGQVHAITHRLGGDLDVNKLFESRRYWKGQQVAADVRMAYKDGVEQGDLGVVIHNLRAPDPFSSLPGAKLDSHLRTLPSLFPNVRFGNFEDNSISSMYTLYRRDSFNATTLSQTTTYQAFSGTPMIGFNFRDYDGWRLASEQSVSWALDEDELFHEGQPVQIHHVGYCYENQLGTNNAPWGCTGAPATRPKVYVPDRLRRKRHALQIAPKEKSYDQYPKPPDGMPSDRSYDVGNTRSNQPARIGPANDTTLSEVYTYDPLDRLIRVYDADIEPNNPEEFEFTDNYATEVYFGYDGFDRRVAEGYDIPDSDVPSEKARRFVFLDGIRLWEEEYGGDKKVTAVVPGARGEVPYIDVPFGEFAVLEDINGAFAGFHNAETATFAVGGSITSGKVANKAQPYVQTASAALHQHIADRLRDNFLVDISPFATIVDAAEALLSDAPQEIFRRIAANQEILPFAEAMQWTIDDSGFRVDYAKHPHLHSELQRLAAIAKAEAFLQIGLAVTALAAPYLLPARLTFVLDAALLIYDLYQLDKELRSKGLTGNALLIGAGAALGFGGTVASFNRMRHVERSLGRTNPRTCRIRNCFVAGTEIATDGGLVPIEDIEVGDQVWARNMDTEKVRLQTVLQTFVGQTQIALSIDIGSDIIEATVEHPFWVQGKGWIPAQFLQVGDTLLDRTGQSDSTVVLHIAPIPLTTEIPIYNFAVAGDHNYFVSQGQVLVHNNSDLGFCGGGGDPARFSDDLEQLIEDFERNETSIRTLLTSQHSQYPHIRALLREHSRRSGTGIRGLNDPHVSVLQRRALEIDAADPARGFNRTIALTPAVTPDGRQVHLVSSSQATGLTRTQIDSLAPHEFPIPGIKQLDAAERALLEAQIATLPRRFVSPPSILHGGGPRARNLHAEEVVVLFAERHGFRLTGGPAPSIPVCRSGSCESLLDSRGLSSPSPFSRDSDLFPFGIFD